jgi:hypothetical protein
MNANVILEIISATLMIKLHIKAWLASIPNLSLNYCKLSYISHKS